MIRDVKFRVLVMPLRRGNTVAAIAGCRARQCDAKSPLHIVSVTPLPLLKLLFAFATMVFSFIETVPGQWTPLREEFSSD